MKTKKQELDMDKQLYNLQSLYNFVFRGKNTKQNPVSKMVQTFWNKPSKIVTEPNNKLKFTIN